MEEDLDEKVKSCAALLISDDLGEFAKGYNELETAFEQPGSEGRERSARLAQELAAFQGGAVLERIFAGAPGCYRYADADKAHNHYGGCCLVSALLTSSKVVVERCLGMIEEGEERRCAQEIYETMSRDALQRARELKRGDDTMAGLFFVVAPLQCLANIARASRVFRDGMQDVLKDHTLFEQLGFFLSAEFLKKLCDSNAYAVRLALSSLAMTLAFSSDTQLWALDKGLLRILASIYEQSPLGQLQDISKRDEFPASRCNLILLRLLESDPATEKLRAHNALSGFRPHRDKISGASPDFDIWGYIEANLMGFSATLEDLSTGQTWTAKSALSGSSVPVVCSWKLCTAGPEPLAGKKFAKCSACKVARYCSKEHQRIHWANHKKHCQAGPVKLPGDQPSQEDEKGKVEQAGNVSGVLEDGVPYGPTLFNGCFGRTWPFED
ncbi:hypothetical protein KFL_007840050 [Klebsormidium nitens]|uniref:MYND-type domain-containing protein n=1 Tax=Klebsormidium nitens TaxID=105231 RepID=A0A1Y1IKN6_KLENI|nr:hypothetical protein KFL_007840050 [Klebsormidium nitens]|eukprot:GAQ91435.1 hypothetical protein KFL_007840050 [Klebsormidium nitens]